MKTIILFTTLFCLFVAAIAVDPPIWPKIVFYIVFVFINVL